MKYLKEKFLPVLSRKEGTVSVEFVLLFPVIALIVLATLEFGHLWMVRHTLTIATREGARAAVVYIPGTDAERVTQAKQVAQDTVEAYLQNRTNWVLGEDFTVPEPEVIYNGANLVGGTLTVRAQTTNALLVLHKLITNIPVVAETTMRFE